MVFPSGQVESDTESVGLSQEQIQFANLKNEQLNASYGFDSVEENVDEIFEIDGGVIEKNSFPEEEWLAAVQKSNDSNESLGLNSQEKKEDILENDQEATEKKIISEEELIRAVQKNNDLNESLGFGSAEGSETSMAQDSDEEALSVQFSDTEPSTDNIPPVLTFFSSAVPL